MERSDEMNWYDRSFDELTTKQLYEILRARTEIFVVEQQCPYLEVDGRDEESRHLWLEDEAGIIAYCRLIPKPEETHIGRVIVASRVRGTGLGYTLMEEAVRRAEQFEQPLYLQAQAHLKKFYGSFGFVQKGEPYDEDGIPHIDMWKM